MENMELRIGVVGMGGFAIFACQQFEQVEGVRLAAYSETSREPQVRAGDRFNLGDPLTFEALLERSDVDLIYIGTPPSLHFDQALAALSAGKHVIVEKPLALTAEKASRLVQTARDKGLACVANQMQLYNPLVAQVKALIDRGLIGEPLFARFDNFACDEGLAPDHWFWNLDISGGIFLEHGVHFFDLFAHWFGEGEVVCASRNLRPDSGLEEQVECMARYGGVNAHFLHSFTQANRMDRQEFRILFERGDIVMEEWVPTRFRLEALVDDAEAKALIETFPGATFDVTTMYGGTDREFTARHKRHRATQRIVMHGGDREEKMHVYGRLLRSMIADQRAWIANPSNERLLTEDNGLRAVVMAERATQLAKG
ncbi:MAG: Inositol 2-dehydrogenase/D-chiro-inositol 3-dehydrogenase [Fimbriimonadaceae bacterium]|nr:Inositol 2-dehydrogenase/D-chiro-inositol 3-dehydrogenase [Fimbriimonadaceae bacterium]